MQMNYSYIYQETGEIFINYFSSGFVPLLFQLIIIAIFIYPMKILAGWLYKLNTIEFKLV